MQKNKVHQGDCVQLLQQLDAGSIDLVFADPPFNIGYDYDVYDDRQSSAKYLEWCGQWIAGVYRALKPSGTFWLAIGDEYAAELKIQSQQAGFHCRSWVIWYYTFGVNCANGFSRSHTHLFHFIKDKKKFTFNRTHPQIRVPSARALVYADSRANPNGRLPDNTWITRPQDAPQFLGFAPQHDTWYFARIAGTFKEREGFHGCQMPEQLLARIIRTSSCLNELVLDPFCGSGTTVSVAKKLGRHWLGFELSTEYVKYISQRLEKTQVGDAIDGPADPINSAPSTAKGKQRKKSKDDSAAQVVDKAYRECGYPVDYILCNKSMNSDFTQTCIKLGKGGTAYMWNRLLLAMRKSGQLSASKKSGEPISQSQFESLGNAAELAWRLLAVDYRKTLDDILCSPDFAAQFDLLATELMAEEEQAQPTELRQTALSIRKRCHEARLQAQELFPQWLSCKRKSLEKVDVGGSMQALDMPGAFVLESKKEPLYVGQSQNIRACVERLLTIDCWQRFEFDTIRYLSCPEKVGTRFALKSALVSSFRTPLNCRLLCSDSEI